MEASPTNSTLNTAGSGSNNFAFGAMTTLFFIWGFITALNDILLPYLKSAFDLTYLQAGLVQFCFFGAYFIVSPFAGRMLEKVGYKNGIIIGLMTIALGCVLFYPSADLAVYEMFLLALFVLAAGVTILQVSANPYVAVLGSEETSTSRLVAAQALNSVGHTVGPIFGAAFILASIAESGSADAVKMPYLILAAVLVVVAVVFYRLRLPNIKDNLDESADKDAAFSIFTSKNLFFGVIAIFVYVGAEVSIGSYLVNYFLELNIAGMDQLKAGHMVAYYWGAAMVGRFVGILLTRVIKPSLVLGINSIIAVVLIFASISLDGEIAMWTILAVGFFNSIMFPTIFTLAIKGLGEHTGRGSGYLCQGIVGGAIVPLIQGYAADTISLELSFIIPAVCYFYIVWYAMVGCRTNYDISQQKSL